MPIIVVNLSNTSSCSVFWRRSDWVVKINNPVLQTIISYKLKIEAKGNHFMSKEKRYSSWKINKPWGRVSRSYFLLLISSPVPIQAQAWLTLPPADSSCLICSPLLWVGQCIWGGRHHLVKKNNAKIHISFQCVKGIQEKSLGSLPASLADIDILSRHRRESLDRVSMNTDSPWHDSVKSSKRAGASGLSRSMEVAVDVDCDVIILDKCVIA